MLPHPLTNFEIEKYQNKRKFKGVDSMNNLLKKVIEYISSLGDSSPFFLRHLPLESAFPPF